MSVESVKMAERKNTLRRRSLATYSQPATPLSHCGCKETGRLGRFEAEAAFAGKIDVSWLRVWFLCVVCAESFNAFQRQLSFWRQEAAQGSFDSFQPKSQNQQQPSSWCSCTAEQRFPLPEVCYCRRSGNDCVHGPLILMANIPTRLNIWVQNYELFESKTTN